MIGRPQSLCRALFYYRYLKTRCQGHVNYSEQSSCNLDEELSLVNVILPWTMDMREKQASNMRLEGATIQCTKKEPYILEPDFDRGQV